MSTRSWSSITVWTSQNQDSRRAQLSNIPYYYLHKVCKRHGNSFLLSAWTNYTAEWLTKDSLQDTTPLHKCGSTECLARLHQHMRLYMAVRIHHALKVSNTGITYGHNRNKKNFEMMKLPLWVKGLSCRTPGLQKTWSDKYKLSE